MNPDILIKRLEDIGNSMDSVISHPLSVIDEAFRELRKIATILSADKDFLKLDKLGVFSDDDDNEVDGGKPFNAFLQSLNKEKECNPIGIIDEIYSRTYGLIMALEEYKKYVK